MTAAYDKKPNWELRTKILLEQQRPDLAQREAFAWIEAEPLEAYAFLSLATCQYQLHQYKKAQITAHKALHLNPQTASAHYLLSCIYEQKMR